MSTWVIDTNILEHLLDTTFEGVNADGHIRKFLQSLVKFPANIALDDKDRMMGEYQHRLQPRIKASMESIDGQLLRWVLQVSNKEKVSVDLSDGLGKCIAEKACGAERSDHVFVYVAGSLGCYLVSNNTRHINDHSKNLKRCSRKHSDGGMEIFTSQEAYTKVTS